MNKQPEVTARTRARLMGAYWDLYSEMGRRGVTAGAVARRADVSRGTFYQYFSDCDDMLDAIERELIAQLKRDIIERIVPDSPIELAELSRRSAGVFLEHRDKLSALLGEKGDPAFPKKLIGEMQPIFIANLHLAQDDPRVPLLAEFGLTTILTLLRHETAEGGISDPEELFTLAQTLVLRGVEGLIGNVPYIRDRREG